MLLKDGSDSIFKHCCTSCGFKHISCSSLICVWGQVFPVGNFPGECFNSKLQLGKMHCEKLLFFGRTLESTLASWPGSFLKSFDKVGFYFFGIHIRHVRNQIFVWSGSKQIASLKWMSTQIQYVYKNITVYIWYIYIWIIYIYYIYLISIFRFCLYIENMVFFTSQTICKASHFNSRMRQRHLHLGLVVEHFRSGLDSTQTNDIPKIDEQINQTILKLMKIPA